MAATKTAVLTKAASQIGYAESPSGSNRTKYGKWYGLDGQAWCAMFVSWVAAMCDALDIIPKHAYTPAGAAWFKKRGQWHTSKPKSGDIAYFDFPNDGVNRISHVGIVEKVRANGDLVTIEGNTSTGDNRNGGMVMRRVRNPKYVVGYGRPAYKPAPVRQLPVLRYGSRGRAVISLKRALRKAGFDGFNVESNVYGKGTFAAVKAFQKKKRITGDGVPGVVGKNTWKKLGY